MVSELLGRSWDAYPCDRVVREVLLRLGQYVPAGALPGRAGGSWTEADVTECSGSWALVSRSPRKLDTIGNVILTENKDGSLHLGVVVARGTVLTSSPQRGCHSCDLREIERTSKRVLGVYRLRRCEP